MLLFIALAIASTGVAFGQTTNTITAISPATAVQGTTGLLVTFTLSTAAPPAPPADVWPQSVTLGDMTGASVQHVSQYVVTAMFDIPSAEVLGAKDASITFPLPTSGTLVFSMTGGFTVTSGASSPPRITKQPQSQTVSPFRPATFSITASGTAPMHFRWQKNGKDIGGADSARFIIPSTVFADSGSYRCIVTNAFGADTSTGAILMVEEIPAGSFPIIDSGQNTCFDTTKIIPCQQPGGVFYGQDAQHDNIQPRYTLSGDGLTVFDKNTGLTWQRSPDTNGDGVINSPDKLTWPQVQTWPDTINAKKFGGFSDWRIPSIKELYSLMNFNGTDPSSMTTVTGGMLPFIDTNYFRFAYGDTTAGERIIDSQYASNNLYTGGQQLLFGLNLADGRIKGYGLVMPGGGQKTFCVQCVRGNKYYGKNDFTGNGDGTITDRATGLMWAQNDCATKMNWVQTLAWVQQQNAQNHLGHNDWRLPNAKELQSILDYTRSPDYTKSAAIDPLFNCTPITNEAGQPDYGFYWTSTTHKSSNGMHAAAIYVAFGRALGYMSNAWVDVHGAGAQRSDPKVGNPADFPTGRGPQGDAIRIYNFARLVRDAQPATGIDEQHSQLQSAPRSFEMSQNFPNPFSMQTTITVTMTRTEHATIRIYDALGRVVATLADEVLAPGEHSFRWNAGDAQRGIYFCVLNAAGEAKTIGMALVK